MGMRPTFMGFEAATRGLMASQKSIDIVNNNLTNIGTTGYTRQRADMVSLTSSSVRSRYAMNSTAFAGQGANVYGISQIRDTFLDRRFREEYSDVGYYDTTSSILEDLTNSIDEISPSTISNAMDSFLSVWNDMLAKTGSDSTNSANLLGKASTIAAVFQQMSAKIDNVWNQQEYSLGQNVKEINTILKRISELNESISQAKFNCMHVGNETYQPLELMDQRNVLLDSLSAYGDVTYQLQDDGMVNVQMGGQPAVDGKKYNTLGMTTDGSNSDFKTVRVFWNNSGEDVKFTSGSVRANLEMLNGRGVDATPGTGERFEQGILYYKEKIDQFARTFADSFNHLIEIADPAMDPAAGYTPPQYKQLFVFQNDTGYHGASTLLVNPQWDQDSTYILKGSLDKAVHGEDSNGDATKAVDLFKKKLDFGEFTGTIGDYIDFYSNMRLSNNKEFADSRLDTASTISDTLLDQIQQVSGVSFDEEGVDLMMYQKAYNAVSRVFTTLDEMLDKLINSTGTVGR